MVYDQGLGSFFMTTLEDLVRKGHSKDEHKASSHIHHHSLLLIPTTDNFDRAVRASGHSGRDAAEQKTIQAV
jgi:hypothetical protein